MFPRADNQAFKVSQHVYELEFIMLALCSVYIVTVPAASVVVMLLKYLVFLSVIET